MQAIRQCQADAKPTGGDINPKRKDRSANQKPEKTEEKQKKCITRNGSTTTHMVQRSGVSGVDLR